MILVCDDAGNVVCSQSCCSINQQTVRYSRAALINNRGKSTVVYIWGIIMNGL